MAINRPSLKAKVVPKARSKDGAAPEVKKPEKQARKPRRQAPADDATALAQLEGTMAPLQLTPSERRLDRQQTITLYEDQSARLKAACQAYDQKATPLLRIIIDYGLAALEEKYRQHTGHDIPPHREPPPL